MATGTARLAPDGKPATAQPASSFWLPLGPCDATASGAEDAQVRLTRGLDELALWAHHYAGLETALSAAGWVISHDNRAQAVARLLQA